MCTGLLTATLRNYMRCLPLLKPSHCSRVVHCSSSVAPTRSRTTLFATFKTVPSESSNPFQSMKRCLSDKSEKKTVKVQFIDRDGDSFIVDAKIGENLMKVAHQHDIDLEGACEGTLSCCTCHLVVHPDWYDQLGSEPCEDELDMLDMAYGLTDTSRLGCQVVVRENFEGLVVRIPPYEPQYT